MSATLTGSVSFDKASYTQGDVITATVVRSGSDVQPVSDVFTGTLRDEAGDTVEVTESFTVDKTIAVPTTVAVSDSGGRAWTQVSDDGETAVFTATA